jgi:starch synthase
MLKVLFVAAEAAPAAKVGGLADVAGSLPKALAGLGVEVAVALPLYGTVEPQLFGAWEAARFRVKVLGQNEEVGLKVGSLAPGVGLWLFENSTYFARPAIYYGEPQDRDRYFFFSQAVLEVLKAPPFSPDVLHCHDWHTGLLPLWARERARVFTINNLAYQGPFDRDFMARSGLTEGFTPPHHPRAMSFMAVGLLNADVVNTVSETYSREILTPEYGEGLETLLESRKDRLFGILNGIDYDAFDPQKDPHLPRPYSASDLAGKGAAREALQQRMGLPASPDVPLVGMVSRLDEQKGLDILEKALELAFSQADFQLVILGRGRPQYEEMVKGLAQRRARQVAVQVAFDDAMARLIYAGSDLFLMPSRFEPCGLGQMIAMRYGTVPVVRRTGGLADTVAELSPDLAEGRGFVFDAYEPAALAGSLVQGVKAYQQRKAWRKLQIRVMGLDFSWGASARKYLALYQKALEFKGRRG